MLTLFGTPRSRSLRVSWLLEELKLPWQYRFIDFGKGLQRQADFLAISPEGKVPVLQDDTVVLTESAAICLYIAQKYGQGSWLPAAGSAQSAQHWQWCSFIISELEQGLWTMAKHKFALPEAQRCPAVIETGLWEFNKAAQTAAIWLKDSPFTCGTEPLVADILLAHTLNWAVKSGCELPQNLDAFRKAMSSRPAMRVALDKEIEVAEQQKLSD